MVLEIFNENSYVNRKICSLKEKMAGKMKKR